VSWLPTIVTVGAAVAMLLHGPILQFADYHAFADQRALLGVPHAWDVLSNAGFAVAGLWGLTVQRRTSRRHPAPGHAGYPRIKHLLATAAAATIVWGVTRSCHLNSTVGRASRRLRSLDANQIFRNGV
jgi:hypothetical protein